MRWITRLIYEKYISKREAWLNEYVHALPNTIDAVLNWTEIENKELYDHVFQKFSTEMPLPFETGFAKVSQILSKVLGYIYNLSALSVLRSLCVVLSQYVRQSVETDFSLVETGERIHLVKQDETVEGAAMYPILDLVNHGPTPRRFVDDWK